MVAPLQRWTPANVFVPGPTGLFWWHVEDQQHIRLISIGANWEINFFFCKEYY